MQKKKKVKKFLKPKDYDSKIFFVCNIESDFLKAVVANNESFRLTFNEKYKEQLANSGSCLLGKIRLYKRKFALVYVDNCQPKDGVMMARKGVNTTYFPYLNIQKSKSTEYGSELKLNHAILV